MLANGHFEVTADTPLLPVEPQNSRISEDQNRHYSTERSDSIPLVETMSDRFPRADNNKRKRQDFSDAEDIDSEAMPKPKSRRHAKADRNNNLNFVDNAGRETKQGDEENRRNIVKKGEVRNVNGFLEWRVPKTNEWSKACLTLCETMRY